MVKTINFVTIDQELKDMAYGDSVYAWLLLHSHYDKGEDHNYIYRKDFTFEQIGRDIGRTRQTVSKRFKELLELNNKTERAGRSFFLIDRGKFLILPNFRDFQRLDSDTVLNLFRLGSKTRREELIKTYAWILKKWDSKEKDLSYTELVDTFGHSRGNEETYNRYKDILTTLQGAGLIKFRTTLAVNSGGKFNKSLHIYSVSRKASQEWLDLTEIEDKLEKANGDISVLTEEELAKIQ